MTSLPDLIAFNDEKLARKYGGGGIPMSTLYEAYFDGDIDITGDIFKLLRNDAGLIRYPITRQHLQWAVTNFVPDMVTHTRQQDERLVREAYDRGNDFFEWFLGESMVYTTGLFEDGLSESDAVGGDAQPGGPPSALRQAQDRLLRQIGTRLQLQPGDRVLDIGCGWGSLVTHCAKHHGVDAVGITLSAKQTEYGTQLIARESLEKTARILCQDYRDVSSETRYDRIVCLEMIEHVGLKNLSVFCERVLDLLADDGLFLLQWTGLRRGLRSEDLLWSLFMNKYVFPGADAALPASAMLKTLEKAGFELHALENLSGHYVLTLQEWHRNWTRNRSAVLAAYGERWYRIWNFFLAWSQIIAEQGSAGCYQAVLHKNVDAFNRKRWIFPHLTQRRAPAESQAPESSERLATGVRHAFERVG